VPFSALLDANVLVPNALRDTLLRIADSGLYRPLWSEDILAETRRTILRLRPTAQPDRIDYLFSCMNQAFEDAVVTGYESIMERLTNDPGDRHVLAAAVVGRADVIVTRNLRDFPSASLAPFDLEALDPDRFLCYQYDLAPTVVVGILEEQSAATGRARGMRKLSVEDLRVQLDLCGAPTFAARVKTHLSAG
jgi:predicted nucleic acid-binding protein